MTLAFLRIGLTVLVAVGSYTATIRPARAQGLPFPAEAFEANDATARWILAYDRCAWRSTDELLRRPRAELTGLSPIWMCLHDGVAWHGLYGRYDDAADRYEIRFHFRVTQDSVTAEVTPLDTARVSAAARALAATIRDRPEAFARSGARFNSYVQFHGDSTLSVWLLPAWQTNGEALFGAEARFDYARDGRTRIGSHLIAGPIRGVRPDSAVAFRIDSNGDGLPTVGDLFFLHLIRPYFAEVRIQTPRFSSSLKRVGKDDAWIHVVREPAPK